MRVRGYGKTEAGHAPSSQCERWDYRAVVKQEANIKRRHVDEAEEINGFEEYLTEFLSDEDF